VVLARDSRHVERKASELEGMGLPFVVICGEKVDHPKVVHREPRGKWDAINFGSMFVPDDADAVALNDVDTEVHGLEHALSRLEEADLVYCRVGVTEGPQVKFYRIADPIRRRQITYDEEGYRVMRSAIERFNAWLKTFRRAIIRYERIAVMFQAIITFACIIIHMRYEDLAT
jgi:hypothetical protein